MTKLVERRLAAGMRHHFGIAVPLRGNAREGCRGADRRGVVAKQPFDNALTGEDGLERLLGRTRSAVLVEVAGHRTRTTTEVAQALHLAPASASYQIGVLRGAGLVVSRRAGKRVEHTATPLAHGLLSGSGAPLPREPVFRSG